MLFGVIPGTRRARTSDAQLRFWEFPTAVRSLLTNLGIPDPAWRSGPE
jgi:hypothetical protein